MGLSVTDIMFGIIFIAALFGGLFAFVQDNVADAGITLDNKYSVLQNNLTAQQTAINVKAVEVRGVLQDIQETDSGVVTTFLGIKGIGKGIQLLTAVVTNALGTLTALFLPLEFLPGWAIAAATTAILVAIVMALLKALRGGGTDI